MKRLAASLILLFIASWSFGQYTYNDFSSNDNGVIFQKVYDTNLDSLNSFKKMTEYLMTSGTTEYKESSSGVIGELKIPVNCQEYNDISGGNCSLCNLGYLKFNYFIKFKEGRYQVSCSNIFWGDVEVKYKVLKLFGDKQQFRLGYDSKNGLELMKLMFDSVFKSENWINTASDW